MKKRKKLDLKDYNIEVLMINSVLSSYKLGLTSKSERDQTLEDIKNIHNNFEKRK